VTPFSKEQARGRPLFAATQLGFKLANPHVKNPEMGAGIRTVFFFATAAGKFSLPR
jgi:hypothetical protein